MQKTGNEVNGKILDYGGAAGGLSKFFKGWCRYLYDLDTKFTDYAASQGIIPIEKEQISEMKFSLIILSHVLEHVPNPGELLESFKGSLEEGGILAIAVPLINRALRVFSTRSNQMYIWPTSIIFPAPHFLIY